MIVLGARGAGSQASGGGVPGLLAGSVSSQVAAYAGVPVVLERGHWRPAAGYRPGPVVVGVDGSPDSRAALRLAFREAALRSAAVQVICAAPDASGALGAGSQLAEDIEYLLSVAAKERPEVPVLRQPGSSGPLPALLSAAREGQLVVIGRRGLGGVRGMRLGSVGRGVLEHAPCPVAVVSHQ
jgi:nucleotide-binding universal stress UspA family protein